MIVGTYGNNGNNKLSSWAARPVVWLTSVSAFLAAVTTIAATPPLAAHVPAGVATWLGVATVAVTAILGALTHGKVTPVADPRGSDGAPLVPKVARPGAGLNDGPAAGCRGSSVTP